MSRLLVVRAAARAEIADAAAWYEERRADLGLAYLHEVEAVLDRLVLAPFEFAVVSEGETFRRARLNRFPFLVFFEVVGEKVVVLAVAHERRRPGYWRER